MSSILLPDLGEGIEKVVVSCWYVKPGDTVVKGDDIVEIVTDKATFNVPSDISGKVEEIFFKEGEEVTIGSTLATIV